MTATYIRPKIVGLEKQQKTTTDIAFYASKLQVYVEGLFFQNKPKPENNPCSPIFLSITHVIRSYVQLDCTI